MSGRRGWIIGSLAAIVVLSACTPSTSGASTGTPLQGSSTTAPPSDHAGWTSYDKAPIRFKYPPDWHAQQLNYFSTMSSPLVYLSNQPMGKRLCSHREGGGTTCGEWPRMVLREGGVVLRWTANGFPVWHFSHVAGRETTVDGHRAKIAVGGSSASLCDRTGGTPMKVVIDRDVPDNWYELDACFNDSSTTDFQSEIESILGTVQITAK